MIPLIKKEVVEKNAWVEETEFFELMALAQSSPGPIAVNAAVFIGYKQSGVTGSLIATSAIVLPSFIIILIIAAYLSGFRDNPTVIAVFKGMRPAVVALIAAPLYSLGQSMKIGIEGFMLAALAAAAIFIAGLSPVTVVVMAAIGGLLHGLRSKRHRKHNP